MDDPAVELRKKMSKLYCAKLEKKIGVRKMASLREEVQGNTELHSRCPSEKYGIDSGKLMREVFAEVTKSAPPPEIDDKTGNEKPGKNFDLTHIWADGKSIQSHFEGAFWWNRHSNYWE